MGRKNWFWPKIENEIEARHASRTGGNWALFSAGITTLMAIIAIVTGKPVMGVNGLSLIDAAFFGIIAWRLFRYSFAWAIVGLLTMILEQIFNLTDSQASHRFGFVSILILLGMINAVRGTYFLRDEKKKSRTSAAVLSATDNSPIEPV